MSESGSETFAGLALVAGGATLWGTVGIASKWLFGISDLDALAVGFFRLALSVPLLAVLCLVLRGPRALVFRGRERWAILLLGATMALYQVFYFTAVGKAGVTIATLVTICTAPLWVVVLSRVVLGERLSRRIGTALVLGLVGTVFLVGFPADVGAGRAAVVSGTTWALGSALSYAIFVLCSRTLSLTHEFFELIVVGFGVGAMLLLPFALTAGLSVTYSPQSLSALLYIALVPTTLAYVFYFRGMRHTKATTASVVSLMEPLTATILAWLIFGEQLSPISVLGGLLLCCSLFVLSRNYRRSDWLIALADVIGARRL